MTAKLPANWDTMSKAEKVAYANKTLNAPKNSATPASWAKASKESKVALAKTRLSPSPRYGAKFVETVPRGKPSKVPAGKGFTQGGLPARGIGAPGKTKAPPIDFDSEWKKRGQIPPGGPPKRRVKPMPLPKPKTGARGPVKEGKLVIHNLRQRKGVTNRRAKT